MYPVLFKIELPEFLSFLGDNFTVYSYGFFIVIGAILAVSYVAYQSKRLYNLSFDKVNTLFLLLLAAAFIGGKVFLFFEDPGYYVNHFSSLLSGRGFVFYGSLLFCIPTMLVFFKINKLPTLPMLDIMAITTCIVHFFGRLGCFMAGCCHGIEWRGPLSVVFTDPSCLAPTNIPLHPTQLYSMAGILSILIILYFLNRNKKFHGKIFITYLILYAIVRSVIEIFRGDISRGFLIDGYISHSQFISIILLAISLYFYRKLHKKAI